MSQKVRDLEDSKSDLGRRLREAEAKARSGQQEAERKGREEVNAIKREKEELTKMVKVMK